MSEPVPGNGPADDKEKLRLFRWFFFGVFAFLLYQLLLILSLFSNVIIWAVSLTLVFWPAWSLVRRRMPGRDTGAALLFTTGVLLLVLLPVIALFWVMIAQSAHLYPTVSHWVSDMNARLQGDAIGLLPQWMQESWHELQSYLQSNPALAKFDPKQFVLDNIDALSADLTRFGAATARNVLLGIVNLSLILVLMFFCFRDGERFLHWLISIIPMPREQTESVALRIYRTVTAVIRGALLTALAQGVLSIIGYLIAGVPLAVLFGALTGLAGMIPVVGGSLIWLPLGLFVMNDSPGWGLFIILWGLILVSLSDNIIKALFIGKETGMPALMIFCGMLGGANVYGFTGLIAGPILIAVLMAFISIYREQYLQHSAGETDVAR
ncbi:MAG TPA: AI-2E family transporter [Candidatus Acidoferrum sp.]|nr:AI-2E family transporter [Candidatus Acidoferrum sp.]